MLVDCMPPTCDLLESISLHLFKMQFMLFIIGLSEVPMSLPALLNAEPVTFTCASRAQLQIFAIQWLINGEPLDIETRPPGVSVMNKLEDAGVVSSVLTVPTSMIFNGARIVCGGLSEGPTFFSDPALFTLQCMLT